MNGSISKAKQLLLVLGAALLLALAGFTCTGCGASDEDQVRQVLDAKLASLSDSSDEAVSQTLGTELANNETFQRLGIDSTELVQSWLEGYSYEIGDISVDGDTATAQATITSKQLYAIMVVWQASYKENVKDKATTEDEAWAYAGETFLSAIKDAQAATTGVTFTLQKSDGEWTFSESDSTNQQALADALFGGGVSAEDVFG